jgi:hypothetical protein
MKKFEGRGHVLGVVRCAKWQHYGYLNQQLVILLNSLGIQPHVFLAKQRHFFNLLQEITSKPLPALKYLLMHDHLGLAGTVT